MCESLQNDVTALSHLQEIQSDGTNANKGKHVGIIRFELRLHRPLQWFMCLLHINKLPLRHLIAKFDEPTSRADQLTGPMGKLLSTCKSLPVVKFQAIKTSLESSHITDANDLSTDQKYFFDIKNAI